jgi:ribosomal protein L31
MLIPLTYENFAQHSWQKLTHYKHYQQQSTAPITLTELSRAICHYPVALLNHDDQFSLHGVFGINDQKNLFVAVDGSWLGEHVPLYWQTAPFTIGTTAQNEHIVCIDDTLWQADSTEHAFYTASAELTATSQAMVERLTQRQQSMQNTQQACEALADMQLITPWSISLQVDTQRINIEGLYQIDEAKLNTLTAAELKALHQMGALQLAYCQLISQQHLQKLSILAKAHADLAAKMAVQPQESARHFSLATDSLALNFDAFR